MNLKSILSNPRIGYAGIFMIVHNFEKKSWNIFQKVPFLEEITYYSHSTTLLFKFIREQNRQKLEVANLEHLFFIYSYRINRLFLK